MQPQRVTDQEILDAYKKAGSVKAAGALLGIHGSSVHERLQKLGASQGPNLFTEAEKRLVREKYHLYADAGKLGDLARQIGRTKSTICRFAKTLGLTSRERGRPYIAKWKYLDEDDARLLMDMFKASSLGLVAFCLAKGFDDQGLARTLRKFFPDEYEHVIEAKQPRQTMYRLGRQFEYRVRDLFKKHGWFALRSPASKTPVDLMAVSRSGVVLIQCKRGGQLGVGEWNEIYDLAESAGAKPLMACMGIGGRGVLLYEITGRKDGSKRRQPMVAVKLNEAGHLVDDLGGVP